MTCFNIKCWFWSNQDFIWQSYFQNYLHRHKTIIKGLIGTYRTMPVSNPLLNPYLWLKYCNSLSGWWGKGSLDSHDIREVRPTERLADCIADHCMIMGFFESILSLEEGRWGWGSLQTKLLLLVIPGSSMLNKSTCWPCFFVFWVTEGTNLVTQKGRSRYNNTLQLHPYPLLERNGGW